MYAKNRTARKGRPRTALNFEVPVEIAKKIDHAVWALQITKRQMAEEAMQLWLKENEEKVNKIQPFPNDAVA
ncbi:hypothetical protein G7B40_041450 [Aetokthonos hydrillicola Thurmond2011]|jgi:hypothetical protein|uniref:Uncharacterized protein n=1 Tax=Aetokthonos hydrillicola Thurmond2011 TaxID=2712845 RepID=A0AAP5MDS0_9CYAN|nr:hypothetical protein [Aetokthonos hydrillicola]MBO3463077.1 hypothetical protein [Aetokthonos hydrillicola CCALA 1050]MBW4587042.1 hypothetical protein [Aetokthonos hydrillicola CCALA 1050]MDR9900932.1 hypothetical protein [Aetokthonos hydrillicola Thurmond2011]